MTETLYISGTEFRAAGGKFDARSRYLRNGNTLQNFPVATGKTVDINIFVHESSNFRASTMRYSLAGWSFTTGFTYTPSGGSGIWVSGSSYNAPYVLVTT